MVHPNGKPFYDESSKVWMFLSCLVLFDNINNQTDIAWRNWQQTSPQPNHFKCPNLKILGYRVLRQKVYRGALLQLRVEWEEKEMQTPSQLCFNTWKAQRKFLHLQEMGWEPCDSLDFDLASFKVMDVGLRVLSSWMEASRDYPQNLSKEGLPMINGTLWLKKFMERKNFLIMPQ